MELFTGKMTAKHNSDCLTDLIRLGVVVEDIKIAKEKAKH